MSEENTQNMPDGRSFEERVFARFDALDARLDGFGARLDGFDVRLQAMETQAERRAMETRPIWERALAEILEVREGLADVARKLDVLSLDIVPGRANQVHLERRLQRLESDSQA